MVVLPVSGYFLGSASSRGTTFSPLPLKYLAGFQSVGIPLLHFGSRNHERMRLRARSQAGEINQDVAAPYLQGGLLGW